MHLYTVETSYPVSIVMAVGTSVVKVVVIMEGRIP